MFEFFKNGATTVVCITTNLQLVTGKATSPSRLHRSVLSLHPLVNRQFWHCVIDPHFPAETPLISLAIRPIVFSRSFYQLKRLQLAYNFLTRVSFYKSCRLLVSRSISHQSLSHFYRCVYHSVRLCLQVQQYSNHISLEYSSLKHGPHRGTLNRYILIQNQSDVFFFG